jgi:tryptophan synthase alpha chain
LCSKIAQNAILRYRNRGGPSALGLKTHLRQAGPRHHAIGPDQALPNTLVHRPLSANLSHSDSDMAIVPTIATRISRRFAELREAGEMGVVAYITAGDPSLGTTLQFVQALAEAGADVIELGVPFSDPLADGPTIQRASERALKSGTTLHAVLELVRQIRKSKGAAAEVPLVLFSYYNPVFQMGLEKFAANASSAGADGVLIIDLTPEESVDYRRILSAHHLDTIFLAAPTSDDDRLQKISAVSSGFLYLVSRTGVTGAKDALPDDLPALLRRARTFTQLPIAVGFGISLPGHVSVLGGLADAAVVGSALVSEIETATAKDSSRAAIEAASAALSSRIHSLKEAARTGLSRRTEVAP